MRIYIYIYIVALQYMVHIYIYIYMCVCVCACVSRNLVYDIYQESVFGICERICRSMFLGRIHGV